MLCCQWSLSARLPHWCKKVMKAEKRFCLHPTWVHRPAQRNKIYWLWTYFFVLVSLSIIKTPNKLVPLLLLITVTPCSRPSGCLLTGTHWSIRSIRMATVTSWRNRILTLQIQRSWNWTAGPANPYRVICTEPVCMKECCWLYTTEVLTGDNISVKTPAMFTSCLRDCYLLVLQRLSWRSLTTVWRWPGRKATRWCEHPTVCGRVPGTLRFPWMKCLQRRQPGSAGRNLSVSSAKNKSTFLVSV